MPLFFYTLLTYYRLYHPISQVGINWDAVSAIASIISIIVLAITAWVIYDQVVETRKSSNYLEHTIKPVVWFIFRSAKTFIERGYKSQDEIGKYDSTLIVINGSNFPILFYFKISWEKEGQQIFTNDKYWLNEPLHIYPDRMSYPPALLNLAGIIKDLGISEDSKGEIRATIEYRFAARHSPDNKFPGLPETWTFNLEKGIWNGPNGIEDNNIFLPKEGIVQKVKFG